MTIRRTAGIATRAAAPAAARMPPPSASSPRRSGADDDARSVAVQPSLAVSGDRRAASDQVAQDRGNDLRDIAVSNRLAQVPRALAAHPRLENVDQEAIPRRLPDRRCLEGKEAIDDEDRIGGERSDEDRGAASHER